LRIRTKMCSAIRICKNAKHKDDYFNNLQYGLRKTLLQSKKNVDRCVT
jgi:hypothetical protein